MNICNDQSHSTQIMPLMIKKYVKTKKEITIWIKWVELTLSFNSQSVSFIGVISLGKFWKNQI